MRELKRKKLETYFARLKEMDNELPEDRRGEWIEEEKEQYEAMILGVGVPLVRLKDFLNDEYPWLIDDRQRLRNELIEDLSPILRPADDDQVGSALQRLVAKINEMELYSPWQVSGGPTRTLSFPEIDKLFEAAEFETEDVIGAKGPVLKLGSQRYIVHNQYRFNLDAPATEREEFYTIIIRTLTDGTFHKLKRCKECPQFFIADRLSDRFCRPECSEAYFARDAADRVKKSRAKARKKKRSTGKQRLTKSKKQKARHHPSLKARKRPRKRQ